MEFRCASLVNSRWRRLCLWLLLGALVLAWVAQAPRLEPAQAVLPAAPGLPLPSAHWQRLAQGDVPMPGGARAAHAASIVPMAPDDAALFTVFWFSGERESGPDVQIAAVQWMRASAQWGPVQTVLNRHALGEQLGWGIRRLGNPVAWRDAQQRLHLWVVATGAGGWAASRVLHLRQRVAGGALAFDPLATLPLAWGGNTSFLVRNAALPLQDGGLLLPLHFELGAKVPALARLDAQGRMVQLQRVSPRRHLLQPTVLPLGPQHWLALMRDESAAARIGVAQTVDAGRHWSDLPDLDLPNPDAAVASLSLAFDPHLLAYNPLRAGREHLALARSPDGLQWQALGELARGAGEDEYSYPAMAWIDGALWVVYTVDRARLAWQRWGATGPTGATGAAGAAGAAAGGAQ